MEEFFISLFIRLMEEIFNMSSILAKMDSMSLVSLKLILSQITVLKEPQQIIPQITIIMKPIIMVQTTTIMVIMGESSFFLVPQGYSHLNNIVKNPLTIK